MRDVKLNIKSGGDVNLTGVAVGPNSTAYVNNWQKSSQVDAAAISVLEEIKKLKSSGALTAPEAELLIEQFRPLHKAILQTGEDSGKKEALAVRFKSFIHSVNGLSGDVAGIMAALNSIGKLFGLTVL